MILENREIFTPRKFLAIRYRYHVPKLKGRWGLGTRLVVGTLLDEPKKFSEETPVLSVTLMQV